MTEAQREGVVEAYERLGDVRVVAEVYDITKRHVYRLARQKKATGSVALRLSQRGRKPKLSAGQREALVAEAKARPDRTLQELKDGLGLDVCVSTIWKALHAAGLRFKKKQVHASEQERPDVRKKREEFKKDAAALPAVRVIALDESGVSIDQTRRHGRAVGGKRVVDSAPVSRPTSRTVIAGLTLEGPVAFDTWLGGTTKERFQACADHVLAPELRPGDIVIMDNLSAHHCKGVAEAVEAAGARIVLTPPYSPDCNPIEMLWSKMKADLRGQRIRNPELLAVAAEDAVFRATAGDSRGWFHHAGYDVPGYGSERTA